MAENLPNTCKNDSQNRQKGHFINNKKRKKGKIQKYVQLAIAMYMSLSYWHFIEIVDYWLNISR
jgi:hypothetical protein